MTTVSFVDDGSGADEVAGDGILSAAFVPVLEGRYVFSAVVSGTTSGGDPFRRTCASDAVAVRAGGTFGQPAFESFCVDADSNNDVESLSVNAHFESEYAGRYRVVLSLLGGNGAAFNVSEELDCGVGPAQVTCRVPETEWRAHNVAGSLTLGSALLQVYVDAVGWVDIHDLPALNQQLVTCHACGPNALFRCPGFGHDVEYTTDDDADGYWNWIHVDLCVNVCAGGRYRYGSSAYDGCGKFIAEMHGEVLLAGGGVNQTIPLMLSSEMVGRNGQEGPFTFREFWVFGLIDSLSTAVPHELREDNVVYTTGMYDPSLADFDAGGWLGHPDPWEHGYKCGDLPNDFRDRNHNDACDWCDIANGTSQDQNHNGIPDEAECRVDINGDGVVDPADMADFLAGFFATPPAAYADFNMDGSVDPDDLSDFIAAYFAGCDDVPGYIGG